MAGALGRLSAALILDINDWTLKSDQAKVVAAQTATSIDRTFKELESGAKAALNNIATAVGVSLSVAGMVAFLARTESAIGRMKELAREAGTTVEGISRFEEPARVAGSSLDSVATAIFRMSKAAVEARDPASAAAQALRAIGVSTNELKGLKPDEMFELVARKLAGYSDGLDKNVVIQTLFAKSGREMNPVLAEIAERMRLTATTTDQQAEAAKKLDAQFVSLKMTSEKFWRSIVSDGIPVLDEMLKRFIEAREKGGFLEGIFAAIATGSLGARAELQRLDDRIASLRSGIRQGDQGNAVEIALGGGAAAAAARRADLERQLNDALKERQRIEEILARQEREDWEADWRKKMDEKKKELTLPRSAASTSASDNYIASLEKEKEKLSLAGIETLKYREALIEIEKIKKAGGVVDEERIKNIAREVDAAVAAHEAYKKLAAGEEGEIAAKKKNEEAVRSNIDQLVLGNKQLDFETSLLGMDSTARALAINAREREIAVNKALGTGLEDITRKLYDEKAGLISVQAAAQDQLKGWTDLSGAAGKFFGDLVMNGKSAIDRLRQDFRSFFQDLIALFAQKLILQLGASFLGVSSAGGSMLANAAGSAGAGTVGGSLLTGGMDFFAGTATSLIGGTAGTALGASFANLGLLLGGQAASIGGLVSGLMAALPALGAIGVAITGIAALVGAFSSGGGPKGGGSFFSSYGPTGDLITSAGPRVFTPNSADPQVAAVGSGIAQTFFQTLNALGGTTRGAGFSLGFDTDPRGTAQNRITGVVYDSTGKPIFQQRDREIGRDANQIGPEMQLEASRMLLAALQSSQLPAYLSRVFDGLTPSSATQAQIDAALKQAGALKSIFDIVSRNPLQDVATAIAASQNQFQTAARANETAIRAVMSAYDGSATAAQNLATATVTYYNAQMQLLVGITQASQAISSMFDSTFRNIRLAGMDRQGQYNFYQQDAAEAQRQALASKDPETIRRLAERINADINAAFGLLSPGEQAAQSGAFLQQGRSAQQQIQSRLETLQRQTASDMQSVLNQIKEIIGANTNSMNSAANTQQSAANTNLAAANTPKRIIINWQQNGRQVAVFE